MWFFFEGHGDHRNLHELTHSSPTRLSADLPVSSTPSQSKVLVCPSARRTVAPSTRPVPWISNSCAPKCIGTPHSRGNSDSGQRAVARRLASIIATGLIRSEEHTSELQSLMRISYAVFCLTTQNTTKQ